MEIEGIVGIICTVGQAHSHKGGGRVLGFDTPIAKA